jgi:putative addiction module component (TIGR02574 family)
MKLADFPALVKLPKRQRLRLAEELWFSSVDDSVPISTAQQVVLDERWRRYRAGQVKRLSLEDLERRLQRK